MEQDKKREQKHPEWSRTGEERRSSWNGSARGREQEQLEWTGEKSRSRTWEERRSSWNGSAQRKRAGAAGMDRGKEQEQLEEQDRGREEEQLEWISTKEESRSSWNGQGKRARAAGMDRKRESRNSWNGAGQGNRGGAAGIEQDKRREHFLSPWIELESAKKKSCLGILEFLHIGQKRIAHKSGKY
jgi:hypothetical protein